MGYLQASLGYFGNSSIGSIQASDDTGAGGSANFSGAAEGGWLSLGLTGSYPLKLSGFTLFPIAGIEYDLNLRLIDSNGYDLKPAMSSDQVDNMNWLWAKLGIGADVPLSATLFIRPSALLGYKFQSKLERDYVAATSTGGINATLTWLKLDFGLSLGWLLGSGRMSLTR